MAAHDPLLFLQQPLSGSPRIESPPPPLSNRALGFENGGLYLDSGEAPTSYHHGRHLSAPVTISHSPTFVVIREFVGFYHFFLVAIPFCINS
jgi:hypothetical protein